MALWGQFTWGDGTKWGEAAVTYTKDFTIDSIISQEKSSAITIDSIISQEKSSTITIDSILDKLFWGIEVIKLKKLYYINTNIKNLYNINVEGNNLYNIEISMKEA